MSNGIVPIKKTSKVQLDETKLTIECYKPYKIVKMVCDISNKQLAIREIEQDNGCLIFATLSRSLSEN